jgi:Ca-activated chloride channel family protein
MSANRTAVFFLLLALLTTGTAALVAHPQAKSSATIVQDVAMVQVPIIVFDNKGAVATNLTKSDFHVVQDGIEQQVLYFDAERQPVSFVILDDISQSMTKKIPFVQEATLSVLDPPGAKPQDVDEFSLFGIETRVTRLVPFTSDQLDLQRRVPLLLLPTKGSTALFDGIYAGVTSAEHDAVNKRRAVIIISDGGDNHSRYNLRETRRLLEEAGVPVFAVMAGQFIELSSIVPFIEGKNQTRGLPLPIPHSDTDVIGPAERAGPHNLKALTEVTGGGVFTANRLEDLPRIIRTIGQAVRYRYVLSYLPRGVEHVKTEDNWHKIHIELSPKEKFAGYSLPYYKRGYFKIN